MTIQPTRILFATDRPAMPMNFRTVLRLSGFDAEWVTLRPRAAFASLRPEDTFLVFVDASGAPDPVMLTQAVRNAPHSRFVLSGRTITPEMLLTAIESGIHGVLATGLPVEETAQALLLIWQGERQFRFDCGPARPSAPPAFEYDDFDCGPGCPTAPPSSECDDFDSDWMFGLTA
jgi:DNA-binding NarL/FixJ family response regulator